MSPLFVASLCGLVFTLGLYLGSRWSVWEERLAAKVSSDDEWEPRSRPPKPVKRGGIRTTNVVKIEVPEKQVGRLIVTGLGRRGKIPAGYIVTVERWGDGMLVRAWDDGHNLKKKMLKDAKETL